MSALLTQCPHCNTSFRVTEAQQQAAGGLVRCGSCLAVFSAADNEIRIKSPVQEQALADIEDFFESLDKENSQTSLPAVEPAAGEEVTSPEDPPDPAIVFTMEDETAQAGTTAASVENASVEQEAVERAASIPAEHEAPLETQPSPDATEGAAAAHEELPDIQLPDVENFEVEVFDVEEEEEAAEFASDSAETTSEAESVEAEPDVTAALAYEENDSGAISLGDMRIDELEADAEEDTEEDAGSAELDLATSTPQPQRTSAEDKVQVREYLSALADDEEPLEPVDDTQLDELDEEPLTFTAPAQRSFAKGLLLFTMNLLLLAAIGAQWLYWNRATLHEHPRFSFLAPYVCTLVSCPAPDPLAASNTLSSQQLFVRTHPRFPDALEVSFIFNNDATTPQPFPNLELAFSDINNRLLANRLFTPAEYLPAELQQFDAMPPQTSVQVMLDLADPGEDAVNYSVSFHDP